MDGLEKFHHYCFAIEVNVITDHMPVVMMFKKDVATVSERLPCMLPRKQQDRVHIIYKLGADLSMSD